MLANFHTHTTLSDGKNTPEEVIRYAIDKGFSAIGITDHGYTGFDLTYCIKYMDAYLPALHSLQQKYKDKIQVYVGLEEDARSPFDRWDFDYIIGSSHYLYKDGAYYSVDSGAQCYEKNVEVFGDRLAMARNYYASFCEYIERRKPDIIGHFDLITKYDEQNDGQLLSDPEYIRIAQEFLLRALRCDIVFEVNTGAMARGLRTSPYPCEALLHILKKNGGKVMLSSDSHGVETLDFAFEQTRYMLRNIGFDGVYVLYDGKMQKVPL